MEHHIMMRGKNKLYLASRYTHGVTANQINKVLEHFKLHMASHSELCWYTISHPNITRRFPPSV